MGKLKFIIFVLAVLFGIIPFLEFGFLDFLNFGYINYIVGGGLIIILIILAMKKSGRDRGIRLANHAEWLRKQKIPEVRITN